MSYFALYTLTGAVTTRAFPPAKRQHRYAILIAARNEEAVIGHLLASIRRQDYPDELLTTFVVADNCTDRTAETARAGGAVCWERFDPNRRTKGYALAFLMDRIRETYGKDAFDGYFVFDADNLLAPDYVSRMNDAFDAGERIVTSYRHTKNFDDNWISASYGIHWLRTVRCEHRARSFFRLATRIQGTGILLHRDILRDGWRFTSLTEDRELAAHAVADGEGISFQYDAVFYDEQPTDLKIALRQRLRWAKGNLWVFAKEGGRLFRGIFRQRGLRRFCCYDTLCVVFPRALCTVGLTLLTAVLTGMGTGSALSAFWVLLGRFLGGWVSGVLLAAYTLFMERKRLPAVPWDRWLWYALLFPLFDVIGQVSVCAALFRKVEWKPIPHVHAVSMAEMGK